jgi:hypothetical protein
MRPRSIYCVTCQCGCSIETEKRETKCPRCNRDIQLTWPADAVSPQPKKAGPHAGK